MKDDADVLSDHLASYSTATEALTVWCRDRFAGTASEVTTRILADEPIDPERYRGLLQVAEGEALRHRRVLLLWGETVLSRAANWYLPDRLPASARNRIRETVQPFGAAVRHLNPRRVLISSSCPALSREPSPAHLSSRPTARDGHVLCVHALLQLDGMTVSEVKEKYLTTLLARARTR